MNTETKTDKELAFEKFWVEDGNEADELDNAFDGDDTFEIGSKEYKILTDEEADQMAREYILDSVWAFNKSFLNCHSEAISEMDEAVYSKIQEMCESANKTVLRLIDDVDHFVEDAIASDGRGHFLSGYDGEENEVELNGKMFFVYRIN